MKDKKAMEKKSHLSPWLWHIETRGVITPSDFLSDEEKSRLNGPVVTYTLPMSTREEATSMETENSQGRLSLTRDTMETLIKEGRSTSQLAKLFGVSRGTINNKKRMWGLVRPVSLASRQAVAGPAEGPATKKPGHVEISAGDTLDAQAAEQLLKNIANFVVANGGSYEVSLKVVKVK